MSELLAIPQREFDLYAMHLPHGPNYGDARLLSTWRTKRCTAVGATFSLPLPEPYGFLALRRRVDRCFALVEERVGFRTHDDALETMRAGLRVDDGPEPMPSGERRRLPLFDLEGRRPCSIFKLLTQTDSHRSAARAVEELYLALPQPDLNFASDFQTSNFDARLWELYVFACIREQGTPVVQDSASPDFHLKTDSAEGFVEAVTANSPEPRQSGFPPPQFAPTDPAERMSGDAAARFAKTLRSKLQRAYDQMPHVRGRPFALALADFHGPSTMTWTREALPTYLYGLFPLVKETASGKVATAEPLARLRGHPHIPAGLFRDESTRGLSAVIFSNAGTISKFNRMGFLAGFRPQGVTMQRSGVLFDRRPGALEPIRFDYDILSSEYARLWPGGEAWCVELEVYHNPMASVPFDFDLLPGAAHWFERGGEIVCKTIWKNSVLASVTTVLSPTLKRELGRLA